MYETTIRTATWRRFLLWFALLFAYATWAFVIDPSWSRLIAAAGGALPETQLGFPAVEPQQSLQLLEPLKSTYLKFQAIDIPYAILSYLAFSAAIALGLRATNLASTPLRFALLFPALFLGAEFLEDALLVLFTLGVLPPFGLAALAQQAATNLKIMTILPAAGLSILGVLAALIRLLIGDARKSRAR